MGAIEGFLDRWDRFKINSSSSFFGSIESYVTMETAQGTIFSNKDYSLSTIIELKGFFRMVGNQQLETIYDSVEMALSSYLKEKGYSFQVVMRYDPDSSKRKLLEAVSPLKNTAENLDLDLGNIFDEYAERVSEYVGEEQVFAVLTTKPNVLSSYQRKKAHKNIEKAMSESLVAVESQRLNFFMKDLVNEHNAYVNSFTSAMKDLGMFYDKMSCRDSLRSIRQMIAPRGTSKDWSPYLAGDEIRPLMKEDYQLEKDASHVLYPRISNQLFNGVVEEVDNSVIQVNENLYCPIQINIPSRKVKPFNLLWRKCVAQGIPFQMSFMLTGGGIQGQGLKSILSTLAGFGKNKTYNGVMKSLKDFENNGGSVVSYQVSCMTWVEGDKNNIEAIEKVKGHASDVSSLIQSWGNCDTGEVGDPMFGFTSCLPGVCVSNPSPRAAAPLRDAVKTLPWARPAKVWNDGSMLTRSVDGKSLPFKHGSSAQRSWIEIGVSPMGGGKSVFMNTMNWSFIVQAGLSRLPYLSIIDVGPSSSGIISLIKAALPENKKHLASYHRIRMEKEFSVNLFDTPLGCRYPSPSHKFFLVNFLTLLATPIGKTAPEEGVVGIAETVIELAYKHYSDDDMPKRYETEMVKEVDQYLDAHGHLIKEHGLEMDRMTTWWDIVDFLFEQGEHYLASKAQRYAVPLLPEVIELAKNEIVTQTYTREFQGESITNYFWRLITDSLKSYVIFREPTRFDVSESKIISLDLDEVAPNNGGETGDRQTGVMYMVARHLVASRFFVMPRDVLLMPKRYQDYHSKKIAELKEDPKRLCYDECHRFMRDSTIGRQLIADLETAGRESRKWNLHIGMYSQKITDFPDAILEIVSSVYVLGYGTEKMVGILGNIFGLTPIEMESIKHIGKPGRAGSKMLVRHLVEDGIMVQFMSNTISQKMLWAFSSTTEDTTLRNALYDELGIDATLEVLSKIYPSGSVKELVEKRRQEYADLGEKVDVIKEMIKELKDLSIKYKLTGSYE